MHTRRHTLLARLPLLSPRLASSCLAVLCLSGSALAQFTQTNPGLANSMFPCMTLGDYDHDGDIDVLVAGSGQHDIAFTTLYRNDGGVFTDSGSALLGLSRATAAFGDFDQDGDLDLAMTGVTTANVPTTRIYRNDAGTFVALPGTFQGLFAGAIAWGDYDGDGDLDLLVTGDTQPSTSGVAVTQLYRNDAGVFTSVPHPFQNCYVGSAAWIDYDGDGDMDLLLTGADSFGTLSAILWRNQGGGSFVDAGANLPGMDFGVASWGDFDGDGDLDLLFGGNTSSGTISRVFRNDAGTLVDVNAGLLPVLWSSGAWGDYDHDGDLDVVLVGYDPVAQASRSILYRNDGGTFVDSGIALHNVYLGAVGWLDSDNDGDLDLLLTGNELGSNITVLYRNDLATGTPYCFGDGSGAACPCANQGLARRGCASSIGGGARLVAFGAPSLSADSLVLTGSDLPDGPALYFQGTAQAGPGTPFGDGLLCVGGSIVRLGIEFASGGVSHYPSGADQPVSVRGLVAPGMRVYQVWYRDAAPSFCTAATFNLTNGRQVVWN